MAVRVPSPGFPVPVSLQLVGPMDGEELLCATGLTIEAALSHSTVDGHQLRVG